MKPDPKSEILYICLLSTYTIASAQAIADIKPTLVIAISSEEAKRIGTEQRFEKFLKKNQVNYKIIGSPDDRNSQNALTCEAFPASSAHGAKQWIDDYLVPILKEKKEQGWLVQGNITGSTKGASIALHNCFKWDEIHYTAEGSRNRLEEVITKTETNLPPLSAISELQLLNDNVKELKNPWQETDVALLQKCAEIMYNDYQNPEQSIMLKHDILLRDLWFSSMDEDKIQKKHGVSKEGTAWILPAGELASFFQQFKNLHPDVNDPETCGIAIPASEKHPWSRFIAGTWWEHLVAQWAGEFCSEVVLNVAINRGKNPNNESDLLIRIRNNELRVVECKVEPPNTTTLKDIYTKIGDSISRFGKTTAALMLSPIFFHQIQNKDAEKNFLDACDFRGIKVLQSKTDLEEWLKK